MPQLAWDSAARGRDGGSEIEGLGDEQHRPRDGNWAVRSYWEGAIAMQGLGLSINGLVRGRRPRDMEEVDMSGG